MKHLIPHSTPKSFTFEEIKNIGLPTSYVVETPNFYWTNLPDSTFLIEQIIELKQTIPTQKIFHTLKVSSFKNGQEDFFQGSSIASAREFVQEHIKYQFELYLNQLKKDLNYLIRQNEKPLLRFLHKMQDNQNQLSIEGKIDDIKNKISIVSFFIENKLNDLIKIDIIEINNFILPENIESIKNQQSLFRINLLKPIDDLSFGLNEVHILDLHFKYDFFFNRIEDDKEVKLDFNLETENNKESFFVSFYKTNRNEFLLNSFKDGSYYFFEREDAIVKIKHYIDRLNESLN